jgi:hypothetical protein
MNLPNLFSVSSLGDKKMSGSLDVMLRLPLEGVYETLADSICNGRLDKQEYEEPFAATSEIDKPITLDITK